MAIKRMRLNRKTESGTDTIHLETSAGIVTTENGSNVEAELASIKTQIQQPTEAQAHAATHAAGGSDPVTPAAIGAAPASHTHSKSQITDFPTSMPASDVPTWAKAANKPSYTASEIGAAASGHTHSEYAAANHNHALADMTGVLPASKGGTGVTSIEALASKMVQDKLVTGGAAGGGVSTTISPGTVVNWAGKSWVVVHVSNAITYLALTEIYENCQFNTAYGNAAYAGSNLAARAMAFQNSLPQAALASAVDTTVNGVTAKIFVPSYEQMDGGFSWFSAEDNRVCMYNSAAECYWTSSPTTDANGVYSVNQGGGVVPSNSLGTSLHNVTDVGGFRPFVGLSI